MTSDIVLSERRGAVLVLTLNRPERLNAWTVELEGRLADLLGAGDSDPEVRAIVLTGAGRGFCAGADMDVLSGASGDAKGSADVDPDPRRYPRNVRKPLIAAINGAAAGLGLVEALYCDIRFCTPEAKLTTAFASRGLIAEYGLSWLLPRLVGQSRAFDLLLSARIVLGEEAYRIGLVDRLAPADELLEMAVAYGQELAASCSPTSMAVIKQQILRDADVDFADALTCSERLMAESFARPDLEEGVTSYLERRAPAFPPLMASP